MNSFDDYFKYNGENLTCEGAVLADIAEEYGTPLYCYTERGFRERYDEIDRELAGIEHLICYSIKSNSNINILKIMCGMGAGMDVVSGGEIYRARAAGVPPEKIVYAGVGKTGAEIAYALDTGVHMLNCESFPEIDAIHTIAAGKKKVADIAIRVNPDVDANTHHYITTGKKENKFGIGIETLLEHRDFFGSRSGVNLRGIHCHIGSQISEVRPFIDALDRVIALIGELKKSGFAGIDTVNLGGGFGIRYGDEDFFPMKEWAAEVTRRLRPLEMRLIIEPGRYLCGNNGVLLVKVLYKKRSGEKTFLITDGAMNDLIRPSLYGAFQNCFNCRQRNGVETVDVVGPVCESGDFFAKDRDISISEEGDYLAVMSAGAYGMSMASRYNSRPLPAEVLVRPDGSRRLIRTRESYDELIRNERDAINFV